MSYIFEIDRDEAYKMIERLAKALAEESEKISICHTSKGVFIEAKTEWA